VKNPRLGCLGGHCLEHVERHLDVADERGARLLPRPAHRRQRAEMEHPLRAGVRDGAAHRAGIE